MFIYNSLLYFSAIICWRFFFSLFLELWLLLNDFYLILTTSRSLTNRKKNNNNYKEVKKMISKFFMVCVGRAARERCYTFECVFKTKSLFFVCIFSRCLFYVLVYSLDCQNCIFPVAVFLVSWAHIWINWRILILYMVCIV